MNERDMDAPVTRREMYEALDTLALKLNRRMDLLGDALLERIDSKFAELRGELRALILTTEEKLMHRMDSLLDPHRAIPERINKLESEELPLRVAKLERKVFAPKRRASKR
jgi:hypothetical protein